MTEFKKGDRVVLEGAVTMVEGGVKTRWYQIATLNGATFWVHPGDLKVAPYRDPELRPGQVVMSEDESDERAWWVRRGIDGGLRFLAPAPTSDGGGAVYRPALPAEIRVVWPR